MFDRPLEKFDADERTRTSTRLLPQRPERCASTNSATSALKVGILLAAIEPVKHETYPARSPISPLIHVIFDAYSPPLINIYKEMRLCTGAVCSCS
jgi:hypothetical protein